MKQGLDFIRNQEQPKKTLFDLREELSLEIDKIYEQDMPLKEKKELNQGIKRSFIERLLRERGQFSKVFQTEKGSIYFISKDGKSWRFKKNDDESIRDEPIINKIVFLSSEECDKFKEIKRDRFFQERLVGFSEDRHWRSEEDRAPYEIKKTDFGEGVYPLEIGVSSFPEVIFEETEESIKILGTKNHDGETVRSFASGIHLGHAVTEVYE